jgi:hypothetical protein
MVLSWKLRKRLSSGHSSGKRPRRFRASIEQLEDRTVPSIFIVNTTADTIDVNPGESVPSPGQFCRPLPPEPVAAAAGGRATRSPCRTIRACGD